MCQGKTKCLRPADRKGRASGCSAAQIKKCHGDVKTHPCAPNTEKRAGKSGA